jgi:hypothetical protein
MGLQPEGADHVQTYSVLRATKSDLAIDAPGHPTRVAAEATWLVRDRTPLKATHFRSFREDSGHLPPIGSTVVIHPLAGA